MGPRRLTLFVVAAGALASPACTGDRSVEAPKASPMAGERRDGPDVDHLASWTHEALQTPLRIAISPSGQVWVTDPVAGAVHCFNLAGEYGWSLSRLGKPLGLAVDADGDLYVGDGLHNRLLKLSPEGVLLGTLGGIDEVDSPQDIEVHPRTGDVWVLDTGRHQVARYSAEGMLLGAFGSEGDGDGELQYPTGLLLDPDSDEVLVSDMLNARVAVYGTDGTWKRNLGNGGEDPLSRTQGLARDGEGRIFVADTIRGAVGVLGSDNGAEAWIGELGEDEGEFRLPSDLALDSYGRLLVTSYQTGRIEVFGIDAYTEPDVPRLALATATAPMLHPFKTGPDVDVLVDVASSDVAIVPDTVALNGTVRLAAPELSGTSVVYKGRTYETLLRFRLVDVFPTLAGGEQWVTLTGLLEDGSAFQGRVFFHAVEG